MKLTFTKAEFFEDIWKDVNRLSPYIITEIENPETQRLFNDAIPKFTSYVILDNIETPKGLFNFLKVHKEDLIIITDDVFYKRKNYLDVLEGAICSSPDSCALWPVRYLNEKEFYFKGGIILCTKKTKKQVERDKRFEFFSRDCSII